MKKYSITLLALIVTLVGQAQFSKRIKGNGQMTTVERTVGSYDQIAISGGFDLELVAGSEGRLSLQGESNILEHVVTKADHGKLEIKVARGYNLQPSKGKRIRLTVPVDDLKEISISGSSEVVGKTPIKGGRFKASISGSGHLEVDLEKDAVSLALSGSGGVRFTGQTENMDASISGSGNLSAYGLECTNASVTLSGSGQAQIAVTGNLEARVSGSGNIYYKGDPSQVDAKSSGSGGISKK